MVFMGTQSESTSSAATMALSTGKSNGNSPPVVDLESEGNGEASNGAGTSRPVTRDSRDSREESGSDNEDREGQIRVGKDYQVNPTNYIPSERKFDRVFANFRPLTDFSPFPERRPDQCPERALLVWSPNDKLSKEKRK